MAAGERTRQLNVYIDEEKKQKLNVHCAQNDKSQRAVVDEALDLYFEKHDPKAK